MEKLKAYFDAISPLSEATWQTVSSLFKPAELSAGTYFVKEGQYARKVAFLEAGVVRAFFTNQEGKAYNKQFFVEPSLIGAYTSLLTGEKNRIPQQALTACTIWEANYADLENLYGTYPDLERLGRKIAEHYFLEKEQKELQMALLDASERYSIFKRRFPHLEQLIPQYHIASYLSISPTQLSRLRKKRMTKS